MAQTNDTANEKPRLICAADVPYELPFFLIEPYIQLRKLNLIQADNGMGKTALACGLAALISTGKPLLCSPCKESGNVLLLCTEDDLPVLRGRIEASGGDLSRCFFLNQYSGINFNSPELEKFIMDIDAKMVVFDPIQHFLGSGVDMFRANETRPVLQSLVEMVARHDCAGVLISHVSKSTADKSHVNRAQGSADIPAIMRSILEIAIDPDNPNQRIAVHVKCSNSATAEIRAANPNLDCDHLHNGDELIVPSTRFRTSDTVGCVGIGQVVATYFTPVTEQAIISRQYGQNK